MSITDAISFFTQLSFPVAVAAYLLTVMSRQMERIRTNQIRLMVLVALISSELGIAVPDRELSDIVEAVKRGQKDKGE